MEYSDWKLPAPVLIIKGGFLVERGRRRKFTLKTERMIHVFKNKRFCIVTFLNSNLYTYSRPTKKINRFFHKIIFSSCL